MRMLTIAHRGACTRCPENTLPAYYKACALGADVVEIDARRTLDGEWVAMHDPRVDRTTDGSGSVNELTLAAIRRLDAGVWFAPACRGVKVPTLKEALGALRGLAAILLDVKDDSRPDELVALVESQKVEIMCTLGFRRVEPIKAVKALNPNVRTLGFIPRPHTEEGVDEYIAAGADVIRFWLAEVRADLIQRVHRAGKAVWVMAGDIDRAGLDRLRELGCDGVLVNDPAVAV